MNNVKNFEKVIQILIHISMIAKNQSPMNRDSSNFRFWKRKFFEVQFRSVLY